MDPQFLLMAVVTSMPRRGGIVQAQVQKAGTMPAVGVAMPSPTQRCGFMQEQVAETHLIAHGYRICERNWSGGGSEVDRIAWDGDLLCFIEVRSRAGSGFGSPASTVGRAKQRRLIRAAMTYLLRFPPGRSPMVRFDVVSIVFADGPPRVHLFRNAFDAGQ